MNYRISEKSSKQTWSEEACTLMWIPPCRPRSIQTCTNQSCEFLFRSVTTYGLYMLFCRKAETLEIPIMKSLNICLSKWYLLLTKYFFVFIHLIFYLKNKIFSVKNTFLFERIFVANLIFFCFYFDFLFENWTHVIACVIAIDNTPTAVKPVQTSTSVRGPLV